MRIVHVAVSDIAGGAARSAYRLHRGLLSLGVDSTMLVQQKQSRDPSVTELPPRPHPLAMFGALTQMGGIDRNRSALSNTYFSLGWPGQDICSEPQIRQADIINVHWVAGLLSPAGLANLIRLGKPVVWTLHDMRAFTGGCHFSAGCHKFKEGCAPCPQLANDSFTLAGAILADQLEVAPANKITVVTPSRWLSESARASRFFAGSRVEIVPYGIETERFVPDNRSEARAALGLNASTVALLIGADHGAEKRKGFHLLTETFRICAANAEFRRLIDNGEITLLAFGRPSEALTNLPIKMKSLGYVGDDGQLSDIYSAADLFLMPSLEDNLPNTILESLSCGTPVAGFAVGGVPDLITSQTGYLAPAVNAAGFASAILAALNAPHQLQGMRQACRERAETLFPLRLQAEHYIKLYTDLRPTTPADSVSCNEPGPHVAKAMLAVLRETTGRNGFDIPGQAQPLSREDSRKKKRFARHVSALLRSPLANEPGNPLLWRRLQSLLPVLEGKNGWLIRASWWFK